MSDQPMPYQDGDKVFLFLAYFGILALIPYFMFKNERSVPEKEFVYWHAAQGVSLSVTVIVAIIALSILMALLAFVSSALGMLGCLLWPLISLGALGLSIMGWIKAFGGQKWEIPVINKITAMIRG